MREEEFEALGEALDGLSDETQTAQDVVQAFRVQIGQLSTVTAEAEQNVAGLEKGLSRGLRRAFDGIFLDGMKASDALRQVGQSLANSVYSAAVSPVTDHLGSTLADGLGEFVSGLLPFEKGGSFSQGRVMPFAKGGVISQATTFPMRGGTGLMGEAGPEAIMPLARGPDGSLGVRTQGGRSINVTMNISTPDVQGFQRSQSQIAAQITRVLARGNRNR